MTDACAKDVVLYREEGGVAYLTLNRPEKLNALGPGVFALFDAHLDRFAESSDARVAVVHGSGRAFAAGADIEHYVGISVADYAEFMRLGNAVQARIGACPKPVLAAVHGYALGGGLELALACDLIVAAPDARLGLPEVHLGLVPGGGGTQRLARLIGVARTAELLMTGRRFSGEEAVAWGLALGIGDAADALGAAGALATRIAAEAPLAVRTAKRLLQAGPDAPLSSALALEQALGASLFASDDAREGVTAFLEKRPPVFHGR